MTQINRKTKGFTMLEVLIATSLFVVVLVITIGTVGFSAGFQNRISSQKRATDEIRRISDLITRDVRSATSEAKIVQGTDSISFKNGLVELNCIESCQIKNNIIPSAEVSGDNYQNGANVLLIATADSYKVYFSEGNSTKFPAIYFKEIKFSTLKNNAISTQEIMNIRTNDYLISSSKLDTKIGFGGYCPNESVGSLLQPYAQYYIRSQSKNYVTSRVQDRAQATLRSSVTSRKY